MIPKIPQATVSQELRFRQLGEWFRYEDDYGVIEGYRLDGVVLVTKIEIKDEQNI